MIHYTDGYGIAYADSDTALGDIAGVTKQAADTVQAALVRGGIAPPNATDLAAAVVRIGSLENSRTADENRLTALEGKTTRTPIGLTLSASFASYGIAPFTEGSGGLALWKDAQSSVRIVGLLKPAAAIGTTAGVAVLSAPLPVGFRPPLAFGTGAAQTIIRYVPAGGGPGVAVAWHRVSITSAGVINFEAASALVAGNTPLQFDLTFPTAN